MSKNLALSLIGPWKSTNIATHLDTVKIEFTDPPDDADDVVITIRDLTHVDVDKGRRHVFATDFLIIKGHIRGGKFLYASHTAENPVDPDNSKLHEMQVTFEAPDQKTKIETRLPDYAPNDHMVVSHRLKWLTEGRVGASIQSMEGRASFRAHYKCAMIVPTGNAPTVAIGERDPSLPLLNKWATQWEKHLPDLRKKVVLRTVSFPPRALTDQDYAPLVKAFQEAADFAKHGVIALAVGHGDQGNTNPASPGDPWLDISAEDGVELDAERQISGIFHQLFVDELELKEMREPTIKGIKHTAGANTVIKRNALNAIRAILTKREVRLLLLHTCTLGANPAFVQLLSDRLQVRIRAHKAHVTYIGSTPIAASYEDDPPLPQGDHEWPMSQLAFEVAPGEVPSP